MIKNSIFPIFAFCLLFLTACAAPATMSPQSTSLEIRQEALHEKELAYKKIITDQDRIFNISFPLMAANAGFCGGRTAPAFGLTAWNRASVNPDYSQAVATLYNLHARLAVQHVADKSPAAKAGIHSGDFIVAISGRSLPHGQPARKTAYELLHLAGYNPVDILLERKGKPIKAVVRPVKVCDYPVQLDYSNNDINAFTDGKRIVVSKGIVRFAENDAELALVIAHELSHNAMGHIDKRMQNTMTGVIAGLAIDSLLTAAGVNSGGEFSKAGEDIGSQSYSVEFEQEADYVGMYFMERAGYSTKGVADFWRREASEMPGSVSTRSSHPTTPERFLAIERTHREIAAKKDRDEELVPNLKPE
ncbi:MAG: M48 family metallopeptidase [Pseudomonadota bacterium]